MDDTKERADFEATMKGVVLGPWMFDAREGEYSFAGMRLAWVAWKARAAQAAQGVPAPELAGWAHQTLLPILEAAASGSMVSMAAAGALRQLRHMLAATPAPAQVAPELCHFPQPRQQSKSCGECHLQPGERCDICGAKEPSPAQGEPLNGDAPWENGTLGCDAAYAKRIVLSPAHRAKLMAAAGFTARDTRLPCDECGKLFSVQMLPVHKCEGAAVEEKREPDNWRQYATEREDTAQQVIERHRREHECLLKMLAADRKTIEELRATPAQAQQAAPERVHQLLAALTTNDDAHARARFASELRSLYGVAPAQAQQAEPTKWCYSTDEERFHGGFASRDEAISELEGGGGWISKAASPKDLISAFHIGESAFEAVSEALGDTVGEVAECFAMTKDEKTALGRVVLDWISEGPGFNCFGVREVEGIGASSGGAA